MKKNTQSYRLPLSFFLLLVVLALESPGQTPPKALSDRANENSRVYVPEKMYVHLDRPTYLVGETIWLKMLVTGEDLLPGHLSSIGYVDVINGERQAVIQAKVKLEKGKGAGTVQIAPDIPSGNYLVRGYTNWMKNFSTSHFFETHITIINPFTPGSAEYEEETGTAAQGPDLQFFPEGGTALAGVENKFAFKAQAPDGKGITFSGKLIDQAGRTIAAFNPLMHGIGHFLFRPEKGYSYHAEMTDATGKTYTFPFKEVKEEGYAVRVADGEDQVEIYVTAGIQSAKRLYLLQYKGDKSMAYQADLNNAKATFRLPKSGLKPGVNVLGIFDEDLRPVAERLYFHRAGGEASLAVSTDKETYGQREKLSLRLQSPGTRDTIEASVSVFLTDGLPELPQPAINTWLLLSSEIKGQVENPDYYFSSDTPPIAEALDNVMLTHGWRRYRPGQPAGHSAIPEFLPEIKGHLIKGKVVSPDGETPRSHRPVFAAYPSEKILPWVAISDEKGGFILETTSFSGPRELVIQTNFRMDSTSKFLVESPFFRIPDDFSAPSLLSLGPEHQPDMLKRSINMQTQNSYFPQKLHFPKPDSSAFYGAPDFSYYLDDYTRFPTMEEILSEYVPAVNIRRRRGKYYTRVFETGVHKQLFTEDPLLLIDGIPIFDTDRIIQFDPLKIKKVDVVNRMYYLGPLVFPGIVSYSTYTHDLSTFEVDPRALIIAYEGTLRHREFYHPAYDKKTKNDDRLPDFRNLMFWAPSVKIAPGDEAKLDFYTSDQKGKYRIIVQGLSENGIPVSATSQLSVASDD